MELIGDARVTNRDGCDDVDNDTSLTDDNVACNDYVVPVFVNNVKCHALRDSGNFGPVIVDKKLVPKKHINYHKMVRVTGAFDRGKAISIPTAVIRLRSPWFNVEGNITVVAAVTTLPPDMFCIIGNNFYKQHPEVTDIIQVRKSQIRNANTRPDSGLDQNGDMRGHKSQDVISADMHRTDDRKQLDAAATAVDVTAIKHDNTRATSTTCSSTADCDTLMGPDPSHSTVTNNVQTGTDTVTTDGLLMSGTDGNIPKNADNALSGNPQTVTRQETAAKRADRTCDNHQVIIDSTGPRLTERQALTSDSDKNYAQQQQQQLDGLRVGVVQTRHATATKRNAKPR